MSQTNEKKPRPGRPKDEGLAARRREAIIRHSITEFARNGYTGADLDVIAANAGCSKGTLYNYFESKGDLFSASVDHVMFSLVNVINEHSSEDPITHIKNMVHLFLNYFHEHPEYIELLVQERSDFRDRKQPTYYQYRQSGRERWLKRFEQLISENKMRQIPPERAINAISDLLYGTIFMNYFRHRKSNPEQQAEEVLDVLFRGLLTPKGLQDVT